MAVFLSHRPRWTGIDAFAWSVENGFLSSPNRTNLRFRGPRPREGYGLYALEQILPGEPGYYNWDADPNHDPGALMAELEAENYSGDESSRSDLSSEHSRLTEVMLPEEETLEEEGGHERLEMHLRESARLQKELQRKSQRRPGGSWTDQNTRRRKKHGKPPTCKKFRRKYQELETQEIDGIEEIVNTLPRKDAPPRWGDSREYSVGSTEVETEPKVEVPRLPVRKVGRQRVKRQTRAPAVLLKREKVTPPPKETVKKVFAPATSPSTSNAGISSREAPTGESFNMRELEDTLTEEQREFLSETLDAMGISPRKQSFNEMFPQLREACRDTRREKTAGGQCTRGRCLASS